MNAFLLELFPATEVDDAHKDESVRRPISEALSNEASMDPRRYIPKESDYERIQKGASDREARTIICVRCSELVASEKGSRQLVCIEDIRDDRACNKTFAPHSNGRIDIMMLRSPKDLRLRNHSRDACHNRKKENEKHTKRDSHI